MDLCGTGKVLAKDLKGTGEVIAMKERETERERESMCACEDYRKVFMPRNEQDFPSSERERTQQQQQATATANMGLSKILLNLLCKFCACL